MQKTPKIQVEQHWKIELQKLRCWISGFQAGRKTPGVIDLDNYIPGEEVLRQIIMAIDAAKE
jgi:hypothetical protein